MIKYNYQILRDEGVEKVNYVPTNYPTELPDIVLIEGKNSTGKSTLLNIIALSLYGVDNDTLNPSLLEKMKSLLDIKHQELTFQFTISNEKMGEQIIAKKDSPKTRDWKLYRIKNGMKEPISSTLFKKEYNLIYDIPDNPINRLNELVREIRTIQCDYGFKVAGLKAHLDNIINDIESSQDPKEIEKLETKITVLKGELADEKDQRKTLSRILSKLDKYYYSKQYLELVNEYEIHNNRLKEAKKDVKASDKTKDAVGEKHSKLIRSKKVAIQESQDLQIQILKYLGTIGLPRKKQYLIDLLDEFKIGLDLSPGDSQNAFSIIIDAKEVLNNIKKEFDPLIIEELNIYSQLIEFLKHFATSKVIIPGIEKTIPQLLKPIERKVAKYQNIRDKNVNIERCISLLDKLEEKFTNLFDNIIPEIAELQSRRLGEVLKHIASKYNQEDIKKFERNLNEIKQKIDKSKKALLERNITLSNTKFIVLHFGTDEDTKMFESSNLMQIAEFRRKSNHELVEYKNKISRNETLLKIHESDLKEHKNREKHPLTKRKKDLDEFYHIINGLEQKLRRDFDEYIRDIIDKNVDKSQLKGELKKYYSQVSSFLAKKINFVKHGEHNYKIKIVDYLDGSLTTIDDRKLLLKDLGTGQSQSAYLRGKLEASDDRKIIALFDEVAMMDSESLKDITDKMIELYKEKKLLCGIIVQKADKPNIRKILKDT